MAKTRRTQVNLTDLKVKHLKPDPAGEYVQGDTQVPGFGVRMRPHGTATFIVMKRLPGGTAPLRMTLGRVGEIGLAEARDKARQAIAAVRRGVDVNSEKRRARDAVVYRREEAQQVRAETGSTPTPSARSRAATSARNAPGSPAAARSRISSAAACSTPGATGRWPNCGGGI